MKEDAGSSSSLVCSLFVEAGRKSIGGEICNRGSNMKSLSKEERAAKFATKPQSHGLRSRGHRILSRDEQRALFADLRSQSPAKRLENLRVLREAVTSTNNTELETDVYAQSARECILQNQPIGPILRRLVETTGETKWSKMYAIALANTGQFNEAYKWCEDEQSFQYIASVAIEDAPLRHELISAEMGELTSLLMGQLDSRFAKQKEDLEVAFRHPSKK